MQDLSKYDINMKLIGIIVVVVFGLIAILSIIWLIEELVAIINSLLEMAVVLAALGLIGGVLAGLYFSLERRKGL